MEASPDHQQQQEQEQQQPEQHQQQQLELDAAAATDPTDDGSLMDDDDDDQPCCDTDLLADSDDEAYNQTNFGIYQALPVEGEPDWSLDEPDSAEEYLRRVRYEAARCPKVVRVEPAGEQLLSHAAVAITPEPPAISDAPDWAKPNRAWVEKFVADFQALRLQVQQCYEQGGYPVAAVPHVNDEEGWERVCFGRSAQAEAVCTQSDGGAEMTQLTPGICTKIMALEQPEVARLFLRHASALAEACPTSLPLLRAQWLFALAARLEKPVHPEVGAAFRAVLRHCCQLRAGVAQPADPLLPQLNVLIVMAGAYFAQDEQLCSIVDSIELL